VSLLKHNISHLVSCFPASDLQCCVGTFEEVSRIRRPESVFAQSCFVAVVLPLIVLTWEQIICMSGKKHIFFAFGNCNICVITCDDRCLF
jgi:hypothetical protein